MRPRATDQPRDIVISFRVSSSEFQRILIRMGKLTVTEYIRRLAVGREK